MSANDNDTAIDTTEACQSEGGSLSNRGSRLSYLKLAHTKITSFHWKGQEVIVADAPADVFDAYMAQVVEEIVNVNRDQWDIFERWHIINACLEADVLLLMELPEGRLTLTRPDEEERRSTTPLAYDPEAVNRTPEDKEV